MNFYKFYIGDYQRDTAHLSMTEHGAYMLMLQHYYATEKPLPGGAALHRMLRAHDKRERQAIDSVAGQFWTATDGGLVNKRADVEIEKARQIASANRDIAVAREAAKRERRQSEETTSRAPLVPRAAHARGTNHIQTPYPDPDPNPEPDPDPDPDQCPSPKAIGPTGRRRAGARLAPERPLDVAEQVWTDWLALRRAKNAPVTATVLDDAAEQAAKAEMTLDAYLREWCGRGSQAFRASWLNTGAHRPRSKPALNFGAMNYSEGIGPNGELG
jgi:uncharacterized protein YdaU (DUF1376 family)